MDVRGTWQCSQGHLVSSSIAFPFPSSSSSVMMYSGFLETVEGFGAGCLEFDGIISGSEKKQSSSS